MNELKTEYNFKAKVSHNPLSSESIVRVYLNNRYGTILLHNDAFTSGDFSGYALALKIVKENLINDSNKETK